METRSKKNKKLQKEVVKEKRILLTKKLIKIFLIIISIFLIIYLDLRYIETGFIKTKEYMIKDNIEESFNGLKIAHFSDLLINENINNKLNKIKNEINKIKPDIIVYTGDLFNKGYKPNIDELNTIKKFFKEINAPLGKYSVKGDYDKDLYNTIMEYSNFKLLNNEYELIYYKSNNPIAIIGLSNNNSIDLSKIKDIYKITLIHNFDNYNNEINSNITLCGHNLNGEVYIPYYGGLINYNNKYTKSYYEINNNKIYINNGIGQKNNIRLYNHPSISVYRLIKYK